MSGKLVSVLTGGGAARQGVDSWREIWSQGNFPVPPQRWEETGFVIGRADPGDSGTLAAGRCLVYVDADTGDMEKAVEACPTLSGRTFKVARKAGGAEPEKIYLQLRDSLNVNRSVNRMQRITDLQPVERQLLPWLAQRGTPLADIALLTGSDDGAVSCATRRFLIEQRQHWLAEDTPLVAVSFVPDLGPLQDPQRAKNTVDWFSFVDRALKDGAIASEVVLDNDFGLVQRALTQSTGRPKASDTVREVFDAQMDVAIRNRDGKALRNALNEFETVVGSNVSLRDINALQEWYLIPYYMPMLMGFSPSLAQGGNKTQIDPIDLYRFFRGRRVAVAYGETELTIDQLERAADQMKRSLDGPTFAKLNQDGTFRIEWLNGLACLIDQFIRERAMSPLPVSYEGYPSAIDTILAYVHGEGVAQAYAGRAAQQLKSTFGAEKVAIHVIRPGDMPLLDKLLESRPRAAFHVWVLLGYKPGVDRQLLTLKVEPFLASAALEVTRASA